MKKSKLLSILISLMGVGALVGCGGGTPTTSSEDPTSQAPSTSETVTSEDPTSEEATTEEATSEEETSEEATSEEETSEEATSEEATSEEETSEEPEVLVVYVAVNGDKKLAEDIKGESSTNKAEYKLDLVYGDKVEFSFADETAIHYYHWDGAAIDEGAELVAQAAGEYRFYLNQSDEMYHVDPEVIIGKGPQLGVFPKALWTEECASNHVDWGRQEGFSYNYAYAAKNSEAMFFYIRQAVVDFNNVGDGWFQKDNVEIRLSKYMDSKSTTTATQLWASTLNGGSYSEHVSGKVRMTPKASEDDLCIVEYELRVEYFGGLAYEDDITPLMSANIVGGWYFAGQTSGWVDAGDNGGQARSPYDPVITEDKGLVAKENPLGEGTELLPEPVEKSGTGWDSMAMKLFYNAQKSFAVKAEYDFVLVDGDDTGKCDTAPCGELWSHAGDGSYGDWSKGSFVWRGDWWMCNPWTTENGGEGGNGAGSRYVYNQGNGNDWFVVRKDMHVSATVVYKAELGYADVFVYMTNNQTGAKWTETFSTPVSNEGNSLSNYIANGGQQVGLGFGRTNSNCNVKVTFTSVMEYYGERI